MLRSSPASSMQKTYDDCYLICSTAVYFEKQNNEEEALRSWRSALDNIYYFNAYKMSPNYRPKNETEKALQDSLVTMERQCKERVDLLEALKKSREEPDTDAALTRDSSSDKLRTISSSSIRAVHANGARNQVPLSHPNPQRPQMPVRPQSRTLPPTPPRHNSDSGLINLSTKSYPQAATSTTDSLPVPIAKSSRTPSPDKKSGMLKSTLRSGTRDTGRGKSTTLNKTMRSSQPTAAGKAASLAWPNTAQPLTNDTGAKDLVSSAAASAMPLPDSRQGVTVSARPQRSKPPSTYPSRPTRTPRPDPFAGFTSSNQFVNLSATSQDRKQSRPAPTPLAASGVGGGARVAPLGPPTPPIRPAQDLTNTRPTSNGSTGSVPQALEPLAAFPAYRQEFSRPTRMETKKAQSLAALMNANHVSSIGDATIARDTRSPPAKKAPPPIPRKAVPGAGSQRLNSITTGDSFGETTPGSGSDVETGKYRGEKREDVEVMTESASTMSEPRQEGSADWDARVQHLMKNLPRGVDEQAAKSIFNEIVIKGDEVHWDDVAGLDIAKTALKEAVVYPFLRPDLFMGLREPARGMLLFGPPGTGKTMLARAVATESRSTFFAISASSLTSKFLGESEKLVRALFTIAKALAPSIIFVDEIDSLLSARGGSSEHEATRRIKTEFLIQWSDLAKAAAGRESNDKTEGDATRVLVLAATNLPWAIDEAARRRFVRRQYIPLPEDHVRESQLSRLMSAQKHHLSSADFAELVSLTDGFSGSDITALAKDAAMGPLRSLGEKLLHMAPDDIRPISLEDFKASLVNIRPSVSKQGLKEFEDWAKEFGERGG